MNKKIEGLAGKANFGHVENNNIVFDKRLEVFAELIIRECADIATMNQHQWLSAGYYVLKHFEIED